jgi:Flp pilus assembly protein TadG
MLRSFVTSLRPNQDGTPPASARSRRRRAIAATEFALLAPFLAALIVGMFEMGRAMMVKDILTNAARKGCRTGVTLPKTYQNILDDVNNILTDNSLPSSKATITVQIATYTGTSTTPSWGPWTTVSSSSSYTPKVLDKVLVKISMNVTDVLWFAPTFMAKTAIESETVIMLRQG